MSSRRAALIGRFRSTALDRVSKVRRTIAEVGASGEAESLGELLGDLHTMKGEARMLGFGGLARFAHALEHALSREEAAAAEALEGTDQAAALLERALRTELGDDAATEAVLQAAAERLERGPIGFEQHEFAAPGEGRRTRVDHRPESDARWTHVEAGRVDRVCDLVTEVAWTIDRVHAGLRAAAGNEVGEPERLRRLFEEMERSLPRLRELEESAWSLRLVPVEPTLRDLERHGIETAARLDKRVRFQLDAAGTQLERQVLDRLAEPLLHLVHNAVDHGVEAPAERGDKPAQATVRIRAESAGPAVHIMVEDDGRGIDAATVKAAAAERGMISREQAAGLTDAQAFDLLFEAGLSTRSAITEISGRGVGLDVVRRRVEQVGGAVVVDSVPGLGTRVTVTVPATMTRERFVVVETSDALYGIPSRWVRRVGRRDRSVEQAVVGGRTTLDERGAVPLRVLQRDLGGIEASENQDMLLWMETPVDAWAWAVPAVLGERDLVRRVLDPILAAEGLLSGSAMQEDGRLVLLLGVMEVLRRADAQGGLPAMSMRPQTAVAPRARVLVVDDSPIIRTLLSELLTDAGLLVETAVDGSEALAVMDREPIDLVLTDLEMPNMDGFALLEAIRRRSQQLPVIVVTTRGSEHDRRRAGALGANAYLVKTGFEGTALLETVGHFVDVAA